MEFEILGNPDFGEARAKLGAGDSFHAASGAMNWHRGPVSFRAKLMGGFFRSLFRKILGGTSMFINEYQATGPSEVAFSHCVAGTLVKIPVTSEGLLISGGSFTACTPGVDMRTQFGGFKAFFSGKGAFFIEASGSGDVFFGAYGAVFEKELDGELIVDNGHVLAWENTLDWSLEGAGGLKSTLFSGEGLVMRFSGRGRIWVQTRHLTGTAGWITPFLRS